MHDPNGGLRGGKYSLFEAGTHVPFITYWKGKIKPTVSNALVSQLDVLESISALVDIDTKKTDSQNLLNTLLGKTEEGRESLIIEATTRTAYRKGNWVMIPPYKGPEIEKQVNIELGNSDEYLLYNLNIDLGQQNNLAKSNLEKLKEMITGFEAIRGTDYKDIEALELK
ncbi:MAG: Uncharacterised protein [Cryomorphaceae bacterium]|nr:MAG: Uncharacterised protein [Cryomorphaceae bacterium]